MTRLILILAILIGVAACKKDGSPNPSLTGKWNQIEYFNDLAGGCNCWTSVNELLSEKIEFRSDGTFQRTPAMISSFMYCPGIYKVVNDSLSTTMVCVWGGPGPAPPAVEGTHWFSKQGNLLTIYWQGPGSKLKIKYKREN